MPERVLRKSLINCFLIAYLFVMFYELFPRLPLHHQLFKPVKPAVDYAGLWQTFAVFVPNPRRTNIYLDALISFDDGKSTIWQFPRLEQMSILQRLQKERYRKFGNDHAYLADEKMLWPDLARFAAKQAQRPGAAAVSVTLRRHLQAIPPFNPKLDLDDRLGADAASYNSEDMYKLDLRAGHGDAL
jgi:hypothetical protein